MSQQSTTTANLNIAVDNNYGILNQAASNFDSESQESAWVDEEDDDDMDFDPVANSSDQDADFLNPSEDAEAEFHGMISILRPMDFLH